MHVKGRADPSTRHVYNFLDLTEKTFKARAKLGGGRGSRQQTGAYATNEQTGEGASEEPDLSKLHGWEAYAVFDVRDLERGRAAEARPMDEDDKQELRVRAHTWQVMHNNVT